MVSIAASRNACITESAAAVKRLLKDEVKCELVEYEALPGYLKDNEFILGYYRCEWPMKQTILSIFSIHNETINIWTHLIGFIIFLALTICTTMISPDMSFPFRLHSPTKSMNPDEDQIPSLDYVLESPSSTWLLPQILEHCLPQRAYQSNHTSDGCYQSNIRDDVMIDMRVPLVAQPIARWPFFTFLCGAMLCLLASSACHLLSCHSKRCSYVMLRLDYAGISTLIVTSFYPLVYYSFVCDLFFRNLYIGFITAFGVATTIISLLPVFQTSKFRPIRSLLFFSMGVSGLVPILHKLAVFGHRREVLLTTGYELVMGAFYVLGVVIYVMRVPERWMPGNFDLAGQSHQLFHVFVVAGAYTTYLACLVYLKWREIEGC